MRTLLNWLNGNCNSVSSARLKRPSESCISDGLFVYWVF
ncbi:hypothetical protein NEIFL0001_0647 [Neisseria flavescens SK114]|nr:hypothetical protein NEIFL0001_0647 [Neisseria flavescens SK114]